MIKKPFLIIILCVMVAASCSKSAKTQQDPFIDLELLEEEDAVAETPAADSITAETVDADSSALTTVFSVEETLAESAAAQLDAAAPAKPSVNDLYEGIRAFITQYGDEGLYVFDSEDYVMPAPGMKTQYVLAALTTQGGLQAAVAPKGRPSEMESVKLSASEESRAALEAIDAHLKYERAALQRRPF